MKTLALFLALSCLAFADFQPERIIPIVGTSDAVDYSPLTAYLGMGWTVKHVTSSQGSAGRPVLVIFVISPPTPEIAKEVAEKSRIAREAAWTKKREQFESSKPKVEK